MAQIVKSPIITSDNGKLFEFKGCIDLTGKQTETTTEHGTRDFFPKPAKLDLFRCLKHPFSTLTRQVKWTG